MVILLVQVGDHLDRVLCAVAVLQRQALVTERALLVQLLHRGLAGVLVAQESNFPKLLAQEVLGRIVEQVRQKRVDVGDLAVGGVEDEDAVVGRLEQSPEAGFRDLQ